MKVPVRPTPVLRAQRARVKHCLIPQPWAPILLLDIAPRCRTLGHWSQHSMGLRSHSDCPGLVLTISSCPIPRDRGAGYKQTCNPQCPSRRLSTDQLCFPGTASPPSLCTTRTLVPHTLCHHPLLPSPRAEPCLQCTRVGPASLVLWVCSRTSSLKVIMEVVDSGIPWSGHAV